MSGRGLGLYDPGVEHSACGVGFITRKDGTQAHDVIELGEQALCAIPHRGGMSAEGVGDGAGVSIDLSVDFFGALTGRSLERGRFGVGNFFMPDDRAQWHRAHALIDSALLQSVAAHPLFAAKRENVPRAFEQNTRKRYLFDFLRGKL